MQILIQGKKPVTVDPSDFKQGGEAKVWIKGNTVYKIFHDPKHMIPPEKIQELQSLKISNIFVPKDLILNRKKKPIGFTMNKAIGDPLIKLYTTGFRNDNGISNSHSVDLVENIKSFIQKVHERGFLLVDINDMNIIVNWDWITPGFIDINAWETPNFPATAINPNVRDWTSNTFNTLTDWFSFAIITCYLFLGIHPFRGSHNKYNRADIKGRMKDHVSIFNSDVRLPRSVRGFDLIPTHYKEWYKDLFEKGKRSTPPLLPGTVTIIPVTIRVITNTDSFEITYTKEYDDYIVSHKNIFGRKVVRTKSGIWIDNIHYKVNTGVDLLITDLDLNLILAKIEDKSLKLKCLDKNKSLSYQILSANNMMVVDNSLFITSGSDLDEIGFLDMRNKIVAFVNSSWNIMPTTSEIFDGIIYQLIMGKPYFVIPVPKAGEDTSYFEMEIPEINGYKIINAKHENGVVILTGLKGNIYDLFIIRFDELYKKYHCRKIEDVDLQDINFVSLANGIVITILSDGTIEIFRRDPARPEIDKITDPDINTTMKLCNDGLNVLFYENKKLYSIIKKK